MENSCGNCAIEGNLLKKKELRLEFEALCPGINDIDPFEFCVGFIEKEPAGIRKLELIEFRFFLELLEFEGFCKFAAKKGSKCSLGRRMDIKSLVPFVLRYES